MIDPLTLAKAGLAFVLICPPLLAAALLWADGRSWPTRVMAALLLAPWALLASHAPLLFAALS